MEGHILVSPESQVLNHKTHKWTVEFPRSQLASISWIPGAYYDWGCWALAQWGQTLKTESEQPGPWG